MVDPHRVELTTTDRTAGSVVAQARGRVDLAGAAELRRCVVKLLAEGVPVLLDVSGLRLDWAPAPQLFVSAVSAAGGWPLARLVLFGASPHTAECLRTCRVAEAVPVVDTLDDATARIGVRPAVLSCGVELPPGASSVRRARAVVRDACARWGLPEREDAAAVVTELVTDAVEHAGVPVRLRLVLDRSGLRVSVRGGQPGAADAAGTGLPDVARLTHSWGVLHHDDGTVVWAQLPPTAPRSADHLDRRSRALEGTADAAVSAPRRRTFATADPEHAHAFLRGVYGEHTLRLAGAGDLTGSPLRYDGVVTDRFAVERISHLDSFAGVFAPRDGLVVVHPLEGVVTVGSGRAELRVGPGELVVCDAGAGIAVATDRLDVEVVRFEPAAVATVAAELTGHDAPTPSFDLSRPVSAARAAHWRATVAYLWRDVLGNDEVMSSALTRASVFRSLVAMLVETFPNPARDARADPAATHDRPVPRALRRALAFIEERAGDDIGLTDIAAAAGVGPRGLQLTFRRHVDATPLEHLRRVRLARAHRDLQAAGPAEMTVGAIADRWGFPHHGNFSALYLRTYGRSPSVTLRS